MREFDKPTDKQLAALRLIATDCEYEEAGRRLGIAVNTVKWHVKQCREHMCVATTPQAVYYATKKGWI